MSTVSAGINAQGLVKAVQNYNEVVAKESKENLPITKFDKAALNENNPQNFEAPVRKLTPEWVPSERTSSASFKAPSTTKKNWNDVEKAAVSNSQTKVVKENIPAVKSEEVIEESQPTVGARKLTPEWVPTIRTSTASYKAPTTRKKHVPEPEPETNAEQSHPRTGGQQITPKFVSLADKPSPTDSSAGTSYQVISGKRALREVAELNTEVADRPAKEKSQLVKADKTNEAKKLKLSDKTNDKQLKFADKTNEDKQLKLVDKTNKDKQLKLVDKTEDKQLKLVDKTNEDKQLKLVDKTNEDKQPKLVDNTNKDKQLKLGSPQRKLTPNYAPTERTSSASFKAPTLGKKKQKDPEPNSTALSTALEYIGSPIRYFSSVFSSAPAEPEKPKPKPKTSLLVPPTKRKASSKLKMADTPSAETVSAQATGENLADVINAAQNSDGAVDGTHDLLVKEKKSDTVQITPSVPTREKKYDPFQHAVREKKYELVQSVTSRDKKSPQKATDIKKTNDPKRSRSHSVKKDAKPYTSLSARNYSGESKRQSVSPPLKILSANSVKITTSTNMSYRVTSIDREEAQPKPKKDARKFYKYDRSPNNSSHLRLSPTMAANLDDMFFSHFESSEEKFSLSCLDKSNSATTEADYRSALQSEIYKNGENLNSFSPTIPDIKSLNTELPKASPMEKIIQGSNIKDVDILKTNKKSDIPNPNELDTSKTQPKCRSSPPFSASPPRQQNLQQKAQSPQTLKPTTLPRSLSQKENVIAIEKVPKASPPLNPPKASTVSPWQKKNSAISPTHALDTSPKTEARKNSPSRKEGKQSRPNSPAACPIDKSTTHSHTSTTPKAGENNVVQPQVKDHEIDVFNSATGDNQPKQNLTSWFFQEEKRSLSQIKKEEYMGIQTSLYHMTTDSPVIADYSEFIPSSNASRKQLAGSPETFAESTCFSPSATTLGEFP